MYGYGNGTLGSTIGSESRQRAKGKQHRGNTIRRGTIAGQNMSFLERSMQSRVVFSLMPTGFSCGVSIRHTLLNIRGIKTRPRMTKARPCSHQKGGKSQVSM